MTTPEGPEYTTFLSSVTFCDCSNGTLGDTQLPGTFLHRDSFPLQFPHPVP
jgi:hypothetical protein